MSVVIAHCCISLINILLLLICLNDTVCGEYLLQNCSVGIVGKDMEFTIYDDDPVERYVSFIEVLCCYCLECLTAAVS